MSPTLAFTAGYILDSTKRQELAWARLSAEQSIRTTCALGTTMTATMIVMMTE
jgi:hypothetical protein